MNEEDLETTKLMSTMMIEEDNDLTIIEQIEELEEKIEYLDISKEKKQSLQNSCKKIKEEKNIDTQEYLFKLLQKEFN